MINKLIDKIIQFSHRNPDWDGNDGVAPNNTAVHESMAFIKYLQKMNITMPTEVFSSGDGEICFEWKIHDNILEVGFIGNGMISWFYCDGKQDVCTDEEFCVDDIGMNTELMKIMRSI